eukprot:12173405-Ditylum_brightwellii.AAC.1
MGVLYCTEAVVFGEVGEWVEQHIGEVSICAEDGEIEYVPICKNTSDVWEEMDLLTLQGREVLSARSGAQEFLAGACDGFQCWGGPFCRELVVHVICICSDVYQHLKGALARRQEAYIWPRVCLLEMVMASASVSASRVVVQSAS